MIGGVIGFAISMTAVVLLRQRGDGEQLEQFEMAIVFAVAAVSIVLWVIKRRARR